MASSTNHVSLVRTEHSKDIWPLLSEVSMEPFALDALLLIVSLTAWVACRLLWTNRKGSSISKARPAMTKKAASTSAVSEEEEVPHGAAVLRQLMQRENSAYRANSQLMLYRRFRSKIEWSSMSAEEKSQVFFNLCLAAAAKDKAEKIRQSILEGLLCDMERLCVPRTQELYSALLKMATSKRQFKEALALWPRMRTEKVEVTERAVWSCLLFSATEERDGPAEQRCGALALKFFAKLSAIDQPSAKDYGNAIRVRTSRHEGQEAFALIEEMRSRGLEPDKYAYNNAFTACCAGGQAVDLAEQLFLEMKKINGCADAVTYNTLVKAYVQAKRLDDCFALVAEMEASDTSPTSVTYGTLLDACVNEGRMDRAQEVLGMMAESGHQMNTVLYTTMIKGFAKTNKVERALLIFEEMRQQGVEPDRFTFSLVIKVLCDNGQMEKALVLFQSMQTDGHQLDEIIFNNLLGGCIVCKNVALGEQLMQDMVRLGVTPSCASFSVLLKLYSECQAWPEALALLEEMGKKYGIHPEQRLFWQLVHSGLRMRKCDQVLNVLQSLIDRYGAPAEAEIVKMLKCCCNFNLLEAAVRIAGLALSSGGRVTAEQLQSISDTAVRKRKPAVVQAILELAQKHELFVRVDR